MFLQIDNVLSKQEAGDLRARLLSAEWVDGNVTSGAGSASVKRNRQLPEAGEVTQAAQDMVGQALMNNATFLSAALPHTVFPPLFNRYGPGETFGLHVDNAIRVHGGSGTRIRTDLSATLFLTEPEDYEGGELRIESNSGTLTYKLPAGSMLLYPSTTLHRVEEVTKGERVSSFMWLQSLVGDHDDRETLFDLDRSIQQLTEERGKTDREVLSLTRVYHNLVRRWSQV